MGGLVGLVLTNGSHAAAVSSVFASGFKIAWTDGELARLAEVAGKPARLFPTRKEGGRGALPARFGIGGARRR